LAATLETPVYSATMAATPTPWATSALVAVPSSSHWHSLADGIEHAILQASVNGLEEWVLIVRLDPARVDVRVWYDPGTPRTAREWLGQTGADVVINGGFYDATNHVTGLLISDGRAHGRSYRGFGGMFAWRDGSPMLEWLRDRPYRPDPAVAQAVQGFPMLVQDGHAIDGISDNGERNRRSFVALDRSGDLVLGVTMMARWTLTDLSHFLATASEFDAWRALNLDGGASAGLWVRGGMDGASMNSFEPVPAVIAVMSRSS
jgi:uncharacterized protein YigE (DUF2233 family)